MSPVPLQEGILAYSVFKAFLTIKPFLVLYLAGLLFYNTESRNPGTSVYK